MAFATQILTGHERYA